MTTPPSATAAPKATPSSSNKTMEKVKESKKKTEPAPGTTTAASSKEEATATTKTGLKDGNKDTNPKEQQRRQEPSVVDKTAEKTDHVSSTAATTPPVVHKKDTSSPSCISAPKETGTNGPISAATAPTSTSAPSLPAATAAAAALKVLKAVAASKAKTLPTTTTASLDATAVPATATTESASIAPTNNNAPKLVNKKRKLSKSTPSSATETPTKSRAVPVTPHMPLADPVVVQTTHDIMALLQTYGPLSFEQLEYNLPPLVARRDTYLSRGRLVLDQHTLQDILDILVVTGIVQISETKKYTMLSGIPRADVVLPFTVLDQLQSAQVEKERSNERIEMLQKALDKKVVARDELKAILYKYPEVAQDPVHVAALRNLHVDVAAVERDRFKRKGSNKNKKTTDKKASIDNTATTDNKSPVSESKATPTKENRSACKKPKSEPKKLSDQATGRDEAVIATTKEGGISESKQGKTVTANVTAPPAEEAVKSKEE